VQTIFCIPPIDLCLVTKECLLELETSEVGLASMPILKLVFPGPMPATIEFLNEGGTYLLMLAVWVLTVTFG